MMELVMKIEMHTYKPKLILTELQGLTLSTPSLLLAILVNIVNIAG